MASYSVNKVILIGNLTRDPELRYTAKGTPVCSFSIATSRSWTTPDGESREDTEFHNIVAWSKLAEICGNLLHKGRKVYASGRLQTRDWQPEDGVKRYKTEIVIDEMIALGGAERRPEGDAERHPETESKEETKKEEVGAKRHPETKSKDEVINPDDIPF